MNPCTMYSGYRWINAGEMAQLMTASVAKDNNLNSIPRVSTGCPLISILCCVWDHTLTIHKINKQINTKSIYMYVHE